MNESEWQRQVIQLAGFYGWKHLHVRKSIGKGRAWVTSTNREGWPDLDLWNIRTAGLGHVYLELKVPPNKATPEQLEVLDELRFAGARAAIVAYPDDLHRLQQILDHRTPPEVLSRLS